MAVADPRRTAAWQRLSRQVIREEPDCQVRLPGCTGVSTTADHIVEVDVRPDLALVRGNVRGCCGHCNSSRGATYGNVKRVTPPRRIAL